MGQASMFGRCVGATVRRHNEALAGQSLRTTVFKNLQADRIVRALVRCGATPSPAKGVLSVCLHVALVAKDGAAHENSSQCIASAMHVCNWIVASERFFARCRLAWISSLSAEHW